MVTLHLKCNMQQNQKKKARNFLSTKSTGFEEFFVKNYFKVNYCCIYSFYYAIHERQVYLFSFNEIRRLNWTNVTICLRRKKIPRKSWTRAKRLAKMSTRIEVAFTVTFIRFRLMKGKLFWRHSWSRSAMITQNITRITHEIMIMTAS